MTRRLRLSIVTGLAIAAGMLGPAYGQSGNPQLQLSTPLGGAAPAAGASAFGQSLAAPDGSVPPRPPAPIGRPTVVPPPPPEPPPPPQGQPLPPPGTAPLVPKMVAPVPIAPASRVPAAMGAISLSARFGRDATVIPSGLHWRVFDEKPDNGGQFKMIKEERSASPTFVLPPGTYIVHVALGLANVAKRVQVRTETVREVFELPVGGLRFDGRVGDVPIPPGQVSFEIYRGSQFDPGEKQPVVSDVAPGAVALLPEGTYHVVSNYGDGNAVMRYDLRVQAGKLTDARINHRAAVITLKLVGDKGGEAIANTAWSVLTPGGDVIKESIGAFPTVVLAEGEYIALARNEGKVYNREFKVETGIDREIELLAR